MLLIGMKSLTHFFMKNSFVVNMTSILIILLGLSSLYSMKRGFMSSSSSRQIRVEAVVDGATPSEMERYVTYPIEQAIKSLVGIERISSSSSDGQTTVRVRVSDDYQDFTKLEEEIKAKIDTIRSTFPENIRDIEVAHRKRTDQWLGGYAFIGFDETSNIHQEWIAGLEERLLRVDGVATVYTRFQTKNMYIRFDPRLLAQYRIDLSQAYLQVRQAFRLNPVGGFRQGGQQFFVQMKNQSTKIEELTSIVLKANSSGRSILLGDVAKVEYRLPEKQSDFLVNGEKNATFFIMADLEADLLTVRDRMHEFMELEKKSFPLGIKEALQTGDGSSFIERQINALKTNSFYGGILVFIVLCVSLGLRNSLMTSFGIPLAYGATFIVLDLMGINIDLVSIIGMLLVLGILVDDSIIISERHAQYLEEGETPYNAAFKSVMSMWVPITGTVLTTIAAFAPILIGHDQISVMLRAIPIVVITALLASLFECFFILPNHLSHFVKKASVKKESGFSMKMATSYRKTLQVVLRFRYVFVSAFIVFSAWSIYFAKDNLKTDFNLNINEETVTLAGAVKKTNGAQDTLEQLKPVIASINKISKDKYKHYTVQISNIWMQGSFKQGTEFFLVSIIFSQLDSNVTDKKKVIENFLKENLQSYKDLGVFKRIEISRQLQGDDEAKKDALEVQVSSFAPFNTQDVAGQLKNALTGTKGIKSIDMDDTNKVETWEFKPDDKLLLSYGLSRQALSTQLRAHVSLTNVYEYRGGHELFTVYGLVKEGSEQSYDSLTQTPIILGNGNMVAVSKLGSWQKTFKEKSIKHRDLKKSVVLTIPFDKDVITEDNMIKLMNQKIISIQKVYPDLNMKVQNADEQVRKNKTTISKKFLYSVLMIFFILCLILKSIYQPILICLSIPFGLVGVIWAFYLQGLTAGVMAAIGVIGMAGVVVNDALILVNTVNDMRVSWSTFSMDTLIRGCATRLRPIVLTSVTTLGGLFPMAYGLGGDSGFTKPLAMSMAWGLFLATFLTLFLIPAFVMIQADVMKLSYKWTRRFRVGNGPSLDEKTLNSMNLGDGHNIYVSSDESKDKVLPPQ
jgi:multidrug efflux pump subunit AcrB